MISIMRARPAANGALGTKKADVMEFPQVSRHVGLHKTRLPIGIGLRFN